MATYRKKPVVVHAFQLHEEWPEWFVKAIKNGDVIAQRNSVGITTGAIKTLEGVMTISHLDYVVRGVEGEIYPVKPEIFAKTYEPVTDGAV